MRSDRAHIRLCTQNCFQKFWNPKIDEIRLGPYVVKFYHANEDLFRNSAKNRAGKLKYICHLEFLTLNFLICKTKEWKLQKIFCSFLLLFIYIA